ncbi:hypothetical protein ABZU32_12680, partial [Sphaerisporangium sp. NPDC005288]
MTATTQEQAFDPAAPRHVPDPHALFHRMREQAPFHRQVGPSSGRVFWYLTRYADVGGGRAGPGVAGALDRRGAARAALPRRGADHTPAADFRSAHDC